jgi:general stress protein YciG
MTNDNSNRGLASADEETKERVARKGGEAPHSERGLQAADEETRERVAREGGLAHGGGGSSSSGESTHEKKAEAGRKGGEH